MDVEHYKVNVSFELAFFENNRDDIKICSALNLLFHEMVKAWAKDHQMIATATRTDLEIV